MTGPAINKFSCAALVLLAGAAPVRAGNYSASAVGTSSGKFLAFGASARAAAMGEAYCASPLGAEAVRYNPAALTKVEANSAEIMHANYLAGTYLDYGAFARRLGPGRAIGLSALQMSYGSVPETDETGARTGTARPANLALTGAYAYKFEGSGGLLDGSAIGFSASYVQAAIVSTAKTFTASLGLLSPAYGSFETQLAFVAENLAGTLKFDQKADPLPMTFRLGGLIRVQPDWSLTLDLAAPWDNVPYAALGSEKGFTTRSEIRLALRAGYNMRSTKDIEGLSGFATGLGISFNGLALDYALVPFGALGYTHKLSLGFKFGKGPEEPAYRRPVERGPAPEAAPAENGEGSPEQADSCQNCLAPADESFAQKDYEAAAAEYKGALSYLPETDSRRVYVYERLGQIELKGRNMAKAKTYFLAAAQKAKNTGASDPSLVNAYLGLAYCFEKSGNLPAAVKNYEKAMELSASELTRAKIKDTLLKLTPQNQ